MKTLESFDFGSRAVSSKKYNWDEILSGEIVVLEAGKDFECKPGGIRLTVKKNAEKLGLKVRSKVVDGNVVIQAFKPTEEEKAFSAAAKGKKGRKMGDEDEEIEDVEEEEDEVDVEEKKPTPRRRK
jgi:hypothetical protein